MKTTNRIYPEICRPNTLDAPRPEFPAKCPACGARRIKQVTDTPHYDCRAEYACGGEYVHKPQIQNHTNKWWGWCPITKKKS